MGCPLFVSIPVKYLVYCISILLLTSLSSLFRLLPGKHVQSRGLVDVRLTERLAVALRLVLLEIVLRVRQITLHQLYLRHRQHTSVTPVAYLYKPEEETSCPTVAGELFDESRLAAERSSARNCSASVFVIFIMSVLISAEYAIIIQCAVSGSFFLPSMIIGSICSSV